MSTNDPYGSTGEPTDSPRPPPVEDIEDMDDFDMAESVLGHEHVVEPEDLYAILNLERTASDDDVKNAYRRLCLTFHPDKHHRPEDKAAAERKFETIQKAYDVLSDPVKRHIYDSYGAEGLQTSWEVGPRGRSQEEIRQEFERLRAQKREMDLENMVKSKGSIQLTLDATSIFMPDDRVRRFRVLSRPENRGLLDAITLPQLNSASVKHSWNTSLTNNTDLSIQGNVTARNGLGVGGVTGTLRHVRSPMLWGELSGTLGQNPMGSVKVHKNFSADIFATVTAYATTVETPPPLVMVLGRRLTEATTGFMTFKTGNYTLGPWGATMGGYHERSSCSLGMFRQAHRSQWNAEVQAGLQQSHINLSYFRMLPKGVKARASVVLSTSMGLQVGLSGEKKVSKHSRLEIGVTCGAAGGTSLRIRLSRLGQRFVVPIILSPELDFKLAVWATVLPVCASVALNQFYFGPKRRRQLAQRLEEVRAENAELLAKRKNEAEEAVQLMKDSVLRKAEAEESRNGLVIVRALYGKLPDSHLNTLLPLGGIRDMFNQSQRSLASELLQAVGSEVSTEYADVTIAVQALVNNSQLHISGGHSKSSIIGFYDPCFGEPKRLRVIYKFQGKLHLVETDDRSALAAPLRAHITSDGDYPFR
ncbi:hypothetical protein HK104_000027 [Borealophlyctis nickersoniae]|nr:hypothetical protein HK104_000027 [Borealophlyctis nickersoniae]